MLRKLSRPRLLLLREPHAAARTFAVDGNCVYASAGCPVDSCLQIDTLATCIETLSQHCHASLYDGDEGRYAKRSFGRMYHTCRVSCGLFDDDCGVISS
jgi:hypothetical protein